MRRLKVPRAVLAAAGVGALIAAGLVLWPLPAPSEPVAARETRVTSVLHQMREPAEAVVPGTVRMAGTGGEAPTVPAATAPRLAGITGSGARARAWLQGADSEVVPLAVGEELDGWRLTGVGRRGVQVKRGDEIRGLELFAAPEGQP